MRPIKTLSDDKLRQIGKYLNRAITNKEHIHQEKDLPKAALLFYSTNELGYELQESQVNKIVKLAGDMYTENAIKILSNIANTCYDIVTGINDPKYEEFKMTEEKLSEPS